LTGKKIAVFIVNFNMPERADSLYGHITKYAKWPHEIFMIDNGSDLVAPSQHTNVGIETNLQTTGGWNAGLDAAGRNGNWLAYWFLITSAEFKSDRDPLTPMVVALLKCPELVGIHPALTQDSTTAWNHLKARGGDGVRRTWMIDNIASLWRADWFEANGGFDPDLKYGWGIDLELSYKARQQNKWMWIHEGVRVEKVTNIGYTMNRMGMSADERVRLAGANMAEVLSTKYGSNWDRKMRSDYVESWMR